jgi:TPP-dependent indolepyruvate ferredoxin oxidoreductase alpha subunit
VGALKPKNFIHVVLDNEVYGTTGNQPTISNVVPLEKVAMSAGYVNVERVRDRDDLVYEFRNMLKKDGPSMLLIKVNEFVEDAGRVLLDPPDITRRFMKAIER